MSLTNTTTRRRTTDAARDLHWRNAAACQGTDLESFFDESPDSQDMAQRVCGRCPVRATCLTDIVQYEAGGYMLWGVVGGLTNVQRRALRCEQLLGNVPDLEQARRLSSRVFAGFMAGVLEWPADLVASELRKHDVLASVVTVRVALWWSGGKAAVLRPQEEGAWRPLWQRVQAECRDVVAELRGFGLGNRDIAAYLGVSEDALGRAVHAWRRAEGVAAA